MHIFCTMIETLRMRRMLTEPFDVSEPPQGIYIEPFAAHRSQEIESLLVNAYRHGGGDPDSYERWYAQVAADAEFDPALIIMAVDTAQARIAGICHIWTSSFVKDLATAQPWHRRGIGAALLSRGMQAMANRGHRQLDLKVDAGNFAARRLYARLGFAEVTGHG